MNPPADDSRPRVTWRALDDHWSGWIVLGLVLIAMLSVTWRTWPDPVIDFGRELYVPWQLSEGQSLYTDIAYHNGPLSPYINAWWFGVFGVSMSSLFTLNLLVIVAVLALLRSLLRDVIGCGGATLGAVTFLVLFAFGNYVDVSNYNWMSPYSHEMTHGIALSLLGIWFARGIVRDGQKWRAFAAGVVVGLAFLTKAEVFAAGSAGTVVALLAASRVRYESIGTTVNVLVVAAIGGLIPVLTAFGALSTYAEFDTALRGALGTWTYVFDDTLGEQDFFRRTSGLDDVGRSLRRLALATFAWLAVLLPIAVVARFVSARRQVLAAVVLGVGFVGVAAMTGDDLPVHEWLRPLPLILFIALVLFDVPGLWRRRAPESDAIAAAKFVTRPALLVISGLLLAKVVLNVRVSHYGFGLAMPGTVLAFAGLFGPVAAALTRRRCSSIVLRTGIIAAIVGLMSCHVAVIGAQVARKAYRVGSGGDAFFAGPAGLFVNAATDWVADNAPENATMTVMIDCEMLNYLTRRRNPARYGNFNPQQLDLFGESNVRESLDATRPDLIAFVHRDTSEYGPRFFGKDYGRELYGWVLQNYVEVRPPIGAVPFQGFPAGIMFYRRKK